MNNTPSIIEHIPNTTSISVMWAILLNKENPSIIAAIPNAINDIPAIMDTALAL